MGENDFDLMRSVASMVSAGVISTQEAMRVVGFTPPPLPVVRPNPLAIGSTVSLGSGTAVIVGYDPENRRVHLFTTAGEELAIDERELLVLAPHNPRSWATTPTPTPTPPPEPVLLPVTVTRERAIMLD